MSPSVPLTPAAATLAGAIARAGVVVGMRIAAERRKRRWTMRELAERAGVSVGVVHGIEAGRIGSLPTYVRLTRALGLELEVALNDPRRSARGPDDLVHAAMGDTEVARMGGFGLAVGVDEPYQHFRFAGRADVVAWDAAVRALLHIENRTQFRDFQAIAGAWNAKRAYFPQEFANRLALPYGWRNVTHVMVVAWTSEALAAARARGASIRALCPDPADSFAGWWSGKPPDRGTSATIVVLDPAPRRGQATWSRLDEALAGGPRYRDYAQVAQRLRAMGRGG